MSVIPNDNDVLFGRGMGIMIHPGNQRLRSKVQEKKPGYLQSNKARKREIACNIVRDIEKSGGRFLIKEANNSSGTASSSDKAWVCVDTEKAIKKVIHQLREKNTSQEQFSAPSKTMTVPLPEWIQMTRVSTSKKDYINCSISVALKLTNHLILINGLNACMGNHNGGDELLQLSLPQIHIEDVVPENVIISIPSSNRPLEVLDVTFMAAGVTSKRQSSKQSNDLFQKTHLLQEDACFALGNILFALFAECDPSFLIYIGSTDDSTVGSMGDLRLGNGDINSDDALSLPVLKRSHQSTNAVTSLLTKSMKAKIFLQDQGVPLSICRLVSDLLDAMAGNPYQSGTALRSLEEVQHDLIQMRTHPQRFLDDETCPQKALEKTALVGDGELYGRESEMNTLMNAAARVSQHSHSPNNPCEAVFLSGHSGSGKSSIIKQFVSSYNTRDWFLLQCNFGLQGVPLLALLQSFDTFFGKFIPFQKGESSMQESFNRISQSISASIDSESLCKLRQLIPNLSQLFPPTTDHLQKERNQNVSVDTPLSSSTGIVKSESSCGIGQGSNHLKYLFQMLFKSICSGGHPVVIIVDDLQWSDAFTLEILLDLIEARCRSEFCFEGQTLQRGLFIVGGFRDNEVDSDGYLMNHIKRMEQLNVNVNILDIDEVGEHAINKMMSYKLCLPERYTQELAGLVHNKTQGNPLYMIEFLKSIIQSKLLKFSVKSRRWIWDDTSIDILMISDSVVALLTRKLQQLPRDVLEALKVASCFGQISVSTIKMLDLGKLIPGMHKALGQAMKEGILEKAGPIFAFRHDMLQESTYNLILIDQRTPLHKKLATILVHAFEVSNNAELCTIAVDQIKMCKDVERNLTPSERALFARASNTAGKHAMGFSSYEQARGYFELGIRLLHDKTWDNQYSLSLELHEMSVTVSFMVGDFEDVSRRLDSIFTNAKSFNDALNARALRAKFLASQARYAEMTSETLSVLSILGEKFPKENHLENATDELEATKLKVKDVSEESILRLPPMKNSKKMNAMKFMGILVTLAHYYSPTLMPLLCCRMTKMTFVYGFCEDSILGLASLSHALVHYSGDIHLASRISRVTDFLISRNENEHSLRAKLLLCTTSIRAVVEPLRCIVEHSLRGYNSAKIVGDAANEAVGGLFYCVGSFYSIPDLIELQRQMVIFIRQLAKRKQIGILHSAMSFFDTVTRFIGNRDSCGIDARIVMMTNKELYHIAEDTENSYLMHHTLLNQICMHCYFREFSDVAVLAEIYREQSGLKNGTKRLLDIMFVFFEGISALCLARKTKKEELSKIGEKAVKFMQQLTEYNSWNFENKLCLLQAELHHLNQCNTMAKQSYEAAIESSNKHKYFHEEALTCELYGVYLIENKMVSEGKDQLRLAIDKYRKWGATRKADDVVKLISLV